jgi:hypothetical protein
VKGPLILPALGSHADGHRLLLGALAKEDSRESACPGGDGNDDKEMHDLFPNPRSSLRRMMPNVSPDV